MSPSIGAENERAPPRPLRLSSLDSSRRLGDATMAPVLASRERETGVQIVSKRARKRGHSRAQQERDKTWSQFSDRLGIRYPRGSETAVASGSLEQPLPTMALSMNFL